MKNQTIMMRNLKKIEAFRAQLEQDWEDQMKPFSKLIKNQDNLNKRIAKIKNQVINDSDVKQF